MKEEKFRRLKFLFEAAYANYHSYYHRGKDPISAIHEYEDPRDREVAALFAALIAYGNVTSILRSVRQVLASLGRSPHQNILQRPFPANLRDFRHRFTTGADIEILFHWVRSSLRSHGSLQEFFLAFRGNPSAPMRERLIDFVDRFCAQELPDTLYRILPRRERNLKYLLPSPERGSACKRLNMFLRWMVRENDGIDLGLWSSVRPDQLILPIDTHLLQTLRALRWTSSRQATWKVAEAATDKLRLFCPNDPTRYDFALCHLSMSGIDIRRYDEELHAPLE